MLVFIDVHHKIKARPSSARHSKFLHMSKQMHIYVLGLRVSLSLLSWTPLEPTVHSAW